MAELLKSAAPYLTAVSSAYTGYSQLAAGRAAETEARRRAAATRVQANAVQVESQVKARNARKRAELLASRAKAVAGASGAGVSDPTVTDILGDIESGGEYDAASALYSGNFLSQGLLEDAQATEREGRALRSAGRMRAAGTAFSTLTSFAEKYGERKKV